MQLQASKCTETWHDGMRRNAHDGITHRSHLAQDDLRTLHGTPRRLVIVLLRTLFPCRKHRDVSLGQRDRLVRWAFGHVLLTLTVVMCGRGTLTQTNKPRKRDTARCIKRPLEARSYHHSASHSPAMKWLIPLMMIAPALAARHPMKRQDPSSSAVSTEAAPTSGPTSAPVSSESSYSPTSTSSAVLTAPTAANGSYLACFPDSPEGVCGPGAFCNAYGHGLYGCLFYNDCRGPNNACPSTQT